MAEPAFTSNLNKDFLRSVYDKKIIQAWREQKRGLLRYLGLPGPEMLDIIEWQGCIDLFTTIERHENAQHLLFLRVNVKDVEHRLHSLYGEFDDIILRGRDRYSVTPRWPYDLINLDFFGGLIYPDGKRPRAIKKLVANQGEFGHSFLLIISHDLRHGDIYGQRNAFIDELGTRLERDFGRRATVQRFVESYKDSETPDAARQAVYMNVLLRDYGEASHFRVHCRPAVVYTGTGGSNMIHYVTEFQYHPAAHSATSGQSLPEVINLGVLKLQDKQLTPVATPRFVLPE